MGFQSKVLLTDKQINTDGLQNINLILTVVIAIASLISVALFWKQNLILLIILLVLAILMLMMNKSKAELKVFIFSYFLGSIAEVFAITFGAWTYAKSDIIGIPIWLAVLWGIASVFIIRAYVFFKE